MTDALQQGAHCYCVERADNKEGVWNLTLPANTILSIDYKVWTEPVIVA
jgi:hypothetical protein